MDVGLQAKAHQSARKVRLPRRAFAGIRLIEGAVATFVCEAYRAWPVGDHLLLVGKVLQIDGGDDEPLVFHQGRFLSMRLTQMA